MTIEQIKTDKSTVTLALNGRLDTASAPLLEQKIKQWGPEVTHLTLDFAELEYISSMGLRVLLQAKKTFKAENRQLIITNMNDAVREVFEITGFLKLMVHDEKFVVIRKDESGSVVLSFIGQMELENVPMVAKELTELTQAPEKAIPPLIIDFGNLSYISYEAARSLKKAIVDHGWTRRKITARNVSVDMQAVLEDNGLGWLTGTK